VVLSVHVVEFGHTLVVEQNFVMSATVVFVHSCHTVVVIVELRVREAVSQVVVISVVLLGQVVAMVVDGTSLLLVVRMYDSQ